jgi:uncharacterized protein (DUF2252 family)
MLSASERIQKFNEHLIPDMVKLKYKAMSENAFHFFRGTCHLFYEDLSTATHFPDSPSTWLCGDLHLENFGSFNGNNRMEYFDLNDFDESILGPCLWEIARVVTSIYVAFDTLKIKNKEATGCVRFFLEKYAETLKNSKAYFIDPRTATGLVRAFLKMASLANEKVLLKKMTVVKDKRLAIKINNLTHFKIEKKLKKELIHLIQQWVKKTGAWPDKYKVTDAAFRVAGTGSIGLKRYMFMLKSSVKADKYLFIELKSAVPSSVLPFIKIRQPRWLSEADRVIQVKKRMQNVSPALLSTLNCKGQDYVIQELQPTANKIDFESVPGNNKDLRNILTDMAILTASAQIRSGGMQGSAIIDELAAFGNDASWHKPLIEYAEKYSKQVKEDYRQFTASVAMTLPA